MSGIRIRADALGRLGCAYGVLGHIHPKGGSEMRGLVGLGEVEVGGFGEVADGEEGSGEDVVGVEVVGRCG